MSTWQELRDNPRIKKIYEDRSAIIRAIREFFWQKGFLETDTPLAVKLPGQEPYLNPVPVTFHDPEGRSEQFHLVTSPEFSLKKLLAAGFAKIFSITKCFRDYESFGGTHNPEFTMIEWYRAPGAYQDFMDDMEELFKFVAETIGVETMKYKNNEIKVVETRGFPVGASDTYEDLFFKIFLNEIEPRLGRECPIFIYDYPAQMASLSRLCADDPRYAERVECYTGGLELCNGFGELLDADEQKSRLEADRALRQKLGKETWRVDPDFIAALRSGIPASSVIMERAAPPATQASLLALRAGGVALGVDRMVLLFTGAKDINEVIFQSVSDQLTN
ncbi:MAG: Lysine-tRNA ligase [Parcubacteria group bacterium GW2011_GWA2_53_21]|nr:MAG: Lysine-tRNA ligase [Parcubacteria group bacterium GW2011_GWA2_53_21]